MLRSRGILSLIWQPAGQRGFALLVVLWATALIAVLAASFTQSTRTETKLAYNLLRNSQAEALADAGVKQAIFTLLDNDPTRRRLFDGREYGLSLGDGTIVVSIQDEAGKIDLNAAPVSLLQGLFVSLGLTPEISEILAHRVADFRDGDDVRQPGGAEDRDYRDAGLAFAPKNRAFELRQELGHVIGVTPALLAAALPLVTVHSEQAGIDLRVAPAGVLRALPGIDAAELMGFLEARADPDRDLTAAPLPSLTGIGSYLNASKQRAFTIRSEAIISGGAQFVREAVVRLPRRAEQPYQILAWRRGDLGSAEAVHSASD